MNQVAGYRISRDDLPEPTWEVAHLFPAQGSWTVDEYLDLPGNRLVEFSNGFLEVLPMPTIPHQLLLLFLYESLAAFVKPRDLGLVCIAPARVRLSPGKFREPDLFFLLKQGVLANCWQSCLMDVGGALWDKIAC